MPDGPRPACRVSPQGAATAAKSGSRARSATTRSGTLPLASLAGGVLETIQSRCTPVRSPMPGVQGKLSPRPTTTPQSPAWQGRLRRCTRAAAVIMDYSQGGAQCRPRNTQDHARGHGARRGTLWIADEDRDRSRAHGPRLPAFQRGSTRPDMVTMGKGLPGARCPPARWILLEGRRRGDRERRWIRRRAPIAGTRSRSPRCRLVVGVHRSRRAGRSRRAPGSRRSAPTRSRSRPRTPCVEGVINEGLSWLIDLAEPDRSLAGD